MAGRSTHIIVSCPDDSCGGSLFFWPEARTAEGDVVADCCICTRRFSLSRGRLSELPRPLPLNDESS
jgi:hypothetical protein